MWLAPDGNNQQQVKELRQKAETWGDKIRTSHLPRSDTWKALNSIIMRTLNYPLLASTLTIEELNHIMSPILQSALPSIGVGRNLSRKVVYGPSTYLGLGLEHPFISQQLSHLCHFIQYINQQSLPGHLLRTSYQYLQLESGLQSPLSAPYKKTGLHTTTSI